MSDRPDVPAGVAPLSVTEEAAWRALARAIQVVPRVLEVDLLEAQGLSVTEYTVLMNLSEAPGGSMRMKELADHVTISVSGLTRAVSRLERDGRVRRVRSRQDGRGQVACLTRAGQECLERAWPAHLASVRRHVVDHLAGVDLLALTTAMDRIGEVDPGPPAGARRQESSATTAVVILVARVR